MLNEKFSIYLCKIITRTALSHPHTLYMYTVPNEVAKQNDTKIHIRMQPPPPPPLYDHHQIQIRKENDPLTDLTSGVCLIAVKELIYFLFTRGVRKFSDKKNEQFI